MDKLIVAPYMWKVLMFIMVAAVVYSTILERYWVEIRPVSIQLSKLPQSASGMRIVLVSDTHLGFYYGTDHLHELVNQINAQKPDVICFTGDLLDSQKNLEMLDEVTAELGRLTAPQGKFAVLGNHDYRTSSKLIADGLTKGGFQVLVNRSATVMRNGQSITIAGVDNVLLGNPDLDQALQTVSKTEPVILLAHEPDYAEVSRKYPVDLQLSGHSHGGQVRIPFGGPVLTSSLGKTYNAGLYQVDRLTIYTNRGIGTTILPIRFFSRPEITVITLQGLIKS